MYKITAIFIAVIIFLWAFAFIFFVMQKRIFYPIKYKQIVLDCAEEYSLSPYLIFAVINVESYFNESAVSDKGAIGLMQITLPTADYICKLKKDKEYNLYYANDNINYGCFYIRYLLNKFNNLDTALGAYNAGEGNVKIWLTNKEYCIDGVRLIKTPYKETNSYIHKVNKILKKYQKLYPDILDK